MSSAIALLVLLALCGPVGAGNPTAAAQSRQATQSLAIDTASRTAAAASQTATAAQNTANQALSAAQASQQCCDATNEKIDRMFQKSMSK